MIRRSQFDRVLAYVQDSGAADYVETLMRPDGKGGRPRQIPFAVFFAAVILAAEHKPTLTLVNVHKLLTNDLARSYRLSLNIVTKRADGGTHTLTVRQVRYMLEALERKLAHTQGRAPDLTDGDRNSRQLALQNIMDMLVGATIPDHLPAPASYALDGTAIESWARGKKKRPVDPEADHADDDRIESDAVEDGDSRRSFDLDAAWGYQTKTYDNRTNDCFGYHAFGLVGVPPAGADPDTWPKLVERLSVRPANANAVEPSIAMVDSLLALDRPVTELLADREFSYKKGTSWALPLRERGISQVIDMHEGDRGVRDYNGIAMIDGTPHCRAVLGDREDLIRIPRPASLSEGTLPANAGEDQKSAHAARVAEIEAFKVKIAERSVAAFRRVAGPDSTGEERWECPAQAGKVICANCPVSLMLSKDRPVVAEPHTVPALPEPPVKPAKGASQEERERYQDEKKKWDEDADFLRCCRQRTITIPGTVTPKLRQQHYWGSSSWIASYSRRTHVEGAFGNLKSAKTTHVTRGWINVVGIVKTSLMLAAAAVATNIRLLRKWAERTGDRTHPLAATDPEHHGFEELDPNGNPALALAPPEAA